MFIGIFFDNFVTGTLPIKEQQGGLHVTLAYNPSPEQLSALMPFLGKTVEVKIVGYANNNQNEGLQVDFVGIPYFGAEKKHITISRVKTAKPVDTGKLDFSEKTLTDIRKNKNIPDIISGEIRIYGK